MLQVTLGMSISNVNFPFRSTHQDCETFNMLPYLIKEYAAINSLSSICHCV